jgi:hypothetical protein
MSDSWLERQMAKAEKLLDTLPDDVLVWQHLSLEVIGGKERDSGNAKAVQADSQLAAPSSSAGNEDTAIQPGPSENEKEKAMNERQAEVIIQLLEILNQRMTEAVNELIEIKQQLKDSYDA